jgi:hypothetical protein
MFGFLQQIWIRISRASCSVIRFCCIIDFGIFLSANRQLVGLCLAKLTTPNFPYPSFFIISNYWIPLIFFNIFDRLVYVRSLGECLLVVSKDLDWATGEIFNLFLSVIGVKYKLLPSFCVFTIILFCYYFSISRGKNIGFFGWFTFFNRSFCWCVTLFALFSSYIINLFLVILSLSFWHCSTLFS